ncbi:hypothetical protein LEN26_015801 [Aphanomyces euteiches]|nr:hypothetical protein LEN26_015801 [Aphanomyces euteiches]
MLQRLRRRSALVCVCIGLALPGGIDGHGFHASTFDDVLQRVPQDTAFAPVEEVQVVASSAKLADAPFPETLTVSLRTQGINLAFDVALKRDLFASDAIVVAHDGPEAALLKQNAPRPIAYAAKLPDNGYVRLTILGDDANKFHATIKLTDRFVVVDPIEHHKAAIQDRLRASSASTGLVSYVLPLEAVQVSTEAHRQLAQWGRMADCTWTPKQITVGVASDAGFTDEHGGAAKTQSYLTAVYNSINGLYDDQIGVHLTIGTFLIETAVGGPSWNVAPGSCGPMVDMNTQLDALKAWVASASGVPLCGQEDCGTWHLHTNCDADKARTGNVAGLAWIGTLCSSTMGYNTGISIDGGAQTWLIAGHELGHNFGASHTFAEGGIMSYDWNTPMKFYDNGQVCSFVKSVLNKCIRDYTPAQPPSTTTTPTTTISTSSPTTATPRPSTTSTTFAPTTRSPSPTTSLTPTTTVPSSTAPGNPCDCAKENLCREVDRPGCQTFLGKPYCYVVGYEKCTLAKPSATCTNAQGKTLYYLEFNAATCPTPSPSTTTLAPPTTTPNQTTQTVTPSTTTTTAPATTAAPTTRATTTTAAPTTVNPSSNTSATNGTNNTIIAPATTPSSNVTDDPCSCSTETKCASLRGGGCQMRQGKGWCYVKHPKKCFGDQYLDSADCPGQKYMQCDPATNRSVVSIPKDPCACSSTAKCPRVSSQAGCFRTDTSSYCFVEDAAKCFGPGVVSSKVCKNEKLRLCSSSHLTATHWVVSEWSVCSATCGGGKKTRTVSCMDQREITTFTDTSCWSPKPITSVKCNVRSCPTNAFNNTTPCKGPPHSTCKSRANKRLCDCACNLGYLYHRGRRECIPLPPIELSKVSCPECKGDVYGSGSFEVRSHNVDSLGPVVCDGRESDTSDIQPSWLAAFDGSSSDGTTDSEADRNGTNIALIVIATCIAAIAVVLIVIRMTWILEMKILALELWTAAVAASIYDGWELPEYCMEPNSMERYKIEPLKSNRPLQLVNAQVIARHGARAPYYRVFCWEKAASPVDATWNCSTSSVWSEDIWSGSKRGFGRLYKKQYLDGENILTGTCSVGGLLPLGRDQHRRMGELLREAYIGHGPLKLFNTSNLKAIPRHEIYLRSDDEERTLGSGQALVDGMFPYVHSDDTDTEHMLTWMTADGATDYIDHKNDNSCPALNHIMEEAKKSNAWSANANSQDVKQLERDFQQIVDGNFSWDTCLECLMIARCNNIPLPAGTTPKIFDGLIGQVQTRKKIILTYQDAWYAKVDMHRMWVDVLDRIDAAISSPAKTPKLFLTVGHDSTIMPMMAVLLGDSWDGAWTTYAGTLVIELYKERNDERAFAIRVLYNGKPLLLPFCKDVLCDWSAFNASLAFARQERPCAIPIRATLSLWKPRIFHWLGAAFLFLICIALTILMVRELNIRQHDPALLPLLG